MTLESESVLTIGELEYVNVVPNIRINDIDHTLMQSARMGIFGLFEAGRDFLICPLLELLGNLTCTFTESTGMLRLTGEAPILQYEVRPPRVPQRTATPSFCA